MLDQEFHTICVMAATLRAGKAGPVEKAWETAIRESVNAYSTMLASRKDLERVLALQSPTAAKSEEVAESP